MSDCDSADPADVLSARGEIILYPTKDSKSRVECRFEQGTLWLSQGAMVARCQIDKSNMSRHLRTSFADGELDEKAVVAYFATTGLDGKTYKVGLYHLDAVIAVGHRVCSPRGTQFRQRTTERRRECLVKGFAMDDERLKNSPGPSVPDHFDELLERRRDLRASTLKKKS